MKFFSRNKARYISYVKAAGVVALFLLIVIPFSKKIFAGEAENAPVKEFFTNPSHPYTKALLLSLPSNVETEKLKSIKGQPPSIKEKIIGCKFSPRCENFSSDICSISPELKFINDIHCVAYNKIC